MSLPKSRILSNHNGFAASAELRHGSPEQTQIVTVNVNANESQEEKSEVIAPPPTLARTRSVAIKEEEPSSLESSIKSKDNVINAYALILEIVENNPLIVNKYIIANADTLSQLILALTEADSVEIIKNDDVECHCVGAPKFVAIDKIHVIKDNETKVFKYHYPSALQTLYDHKISTKFVIDRAFE